MGIKSGFFAYHPPPCPAPFEGSDKCNCKPPFPRTFPPQVTVDESKPAESAIEVDNDNTTRK